MLATAVARAALAAALVLPGAASSQTPAWSNIVNEPGFKVDVDKASIRMVMRSSGFEMLGRVRMDFGQPFVVPGKQKAGAYYVNELTARCRDDALVVQRSTAHAADGEVLATGENVATIKNPKNPNSFVSVWMHLACNQFKGRRPPTVV